MSVAANFLKKQLSTPGVSQVRFAVTVLDAYSTRKGFELRRTDTVGRLKTSGWTLDFGIAPDEQSIHVPLSSLQEKLPEAERQHWLDHAQLEGCSENFLKMQLSPHACIDDGTFRAWGEEALF